MAGKNTAAFGIYHDETILRNGVQELESNGFRQHDISVLVPENTGTKDFVHEKNSKAPEGATAGAGTGAIVGGVLGWLVGIGSIVIPGAGPFLAAGPIMVALAGVGAGGVTGGLIGALAGAGIPEYEAKRYEGLVKHGGILISVHCDDSDWTSKAKKILKQTGADNISSTGEAGADFAEGDKPRSRQSL